MRTTTGDSECPQCCPYRAIWMDILSFCCSHCLRFFSKMYTARLLLRRFPIHANRENAQFHLLHSRSSRRSTEHLRLQQIPVPVTSPKINERTSSWKSCDLKSSAHLFVLPIHIRILDICCIPHGWMCPQYERVIQHHTTLCYGLLIHWTGKSHTIERFYPTPFVRYYTYS